MTNTHNQATREPNGDARIHLLPATATVVDSPNNATAWLKANARRGAMLYSAPSTNGATLAVIDTPTSLRDHGRREPNPAVTDADIVQIVARRASLGQTERDYDGA